MDLQLHGKNALITGASSGIGKATALTLARFGANIIINYFGDNSGTNKKDAESVEKEIKKLGQQVQIVEADVSNFNCTQMMMDRVFNLFGKLDILINNAAILRDRTLKKMTINEWNEVLNTNLSSVFNCCKCVVNHMIENNWGRVINIASISGQIGFFGQTNYASAKAGMVGFTKAFAREVAIKGITVNAIACGIIETNMAKQIPENILQKFKEEIPMKRFGKPEEIAHLIAFLSSNYASYITGQTINVNGGWYM